MSSVPAYRFCYSPLFEGKEREDKKKKKVFIYNDAITGFSDGVIKIELI